jgi:predicted metal-dependent hydrolase
VETLWSTLDDGDGDAPVPPVGDLEPGPDPAELPPLEVEVVRSAKRRKTVSASIVGGRVVVRMPTWMSRAQEEEYVTALVARLERRRRSEGVDLTTRARLLAKRYDLPTPRSIRFVSNQASRWGSCTPSTGEIRISDRIAGFPTWVLDAVIVHELAHLVHLRHSRQFWEVANRYPLTERALGFLIAKQVTDDELVEGARSP